MRILALLLFLPLVAVAEPATVIRAAELKQAPATDAATLATLPENTAVDALERKGGWTRVKAGAGEGWVRMLSLRFGGTTTAKPGASGLTQAFNVARTGTSGTQASGCDSASANPYRSGTARKPSGHRWPMRSRCSCLAMYVRPIRWHNSAIAARTTVVGNSTATL